MTGVQISQQGRGQENCEQNRIGKCFQRNPSPPSPPSPPWSDHVEAGRPYQNPSIVELHQLFFELENNHQEDPAQDDATVLDDQRGLGHCGNTANVIRRRIRGQGQTALASLGHLDGGALGHTAPALPKSSTKRRRVQESCKFFLFML